MKFNKKKKIVAVALTSTLTLGSLTGCSNINSIKQFKLDPDNIVFEEDKVMNDIEYYGGDERYVDTRFSFINMFSNNAKDYCNHFDTGREDDSIIVGYDKSSVTEEQAKQFDYTFDHLNYLFSVINPEYKFETGFYDEKNCDIFVDFKKLNLKSKDHMYSSVGAYIDREFDKVNRSVVKGAKIHFNNELNFATPQLRYYMLHEMMHALYGSNDVDWEKSPTFSVYNYCDVDFIIRQISCAYESIEDYKNGTIHSLGGNWTTLIQIFDSNGNAVGRTFLPLMTLEEKNSFVSMLPTDVSTLVALYGDSSTSENRKAYIDLLKEVLATNKKIFDIDYSQFGSLSSRVTEQPYYEDGFVLPEA